MRRSLWIVALLVVLAAFIGFQQYSSWSSLSKPQGSEALSKNNSQDGSRKAAEAKGAGRAARGGGNREAVPVLVATATTKTIPVQIQAVGNAEPYATVSVKSQVTGVLQKAHFKEGDDVKSGQILFTIDPRPLEAAVKQAEAALLRDTAQLQNAREQARRYAELVEKQYVSREQYDQIRTNADALEATVAADKAAVENAKVQLSYCYIYSPMNGRVGTLLVNEGNLVRVNDATPLVVINQVNPIYVTFSVPEQNLSDLKRYMGTGQLVVDAAFPSDENVAERGKLEFLDNSVDRSTGTIKLKAAFANTKRRLWPGQFVNIALTLTSQANAVVVPSEAIQVGPEGEQVFVVKEDKRVEVRSVAVGPTRDGEVIVTKGVAPGELVVREGQFLLGPGSRVEIKEPVQAGESKAGGRARKGRGKGDSEAQSAAKPQGEINAGKSGDESIGEGKRGRRNRAAAGAEDKGKAQRGES